MHTQTNQNNTSLIVGGSGIKFKSHLTVETETYIRNADVVLYLINEPAMQQWIKSNSKASISLDSYYGKFELRSDCYNAMAECVMDEVRKNQHVCFILYGHPSVFANPGITAVKQAKIEGYYAKMLPGISSEDCLFADLLINPGSNGCLSYEATDFLIYQRMIDPSCHLILWQVGFIGALDYPANHDNAIGTELLIKQLYLYYDHDHEVIIYEAAQYPHVEPIIQKVQLGQLQNATLSPTATLYIPPSLTNRPNTDMIRALNLHGFLR